MIKAVEDNLEIMRREVSSKMASSKGDKIKDGTEGNNYNSMLYLYLIRSG